MLSSDEEESSNKLASDDDDDQMSEEDIDLSDDNDYEFTEAAAGESNV